MSESNTSSAQSQQHTPEPIEISQGRDEPQRLRFGAPVAETMFRGRYIPCPAPKFRDARTGKPVIFPWDKKPKAD